MTPSLSDIPAPDARGAPRHLTVLMVGKVRGRGGEYACVVQDVSRHGLKARFPHAPAIGERLAFSLRGQSERAGTVRWAEGLCAGIEFDQPLDLTTILGHEQTRLPRAPRFQCGQSAMLLLGEARHVIELIDVSLGGAKFSLAQPLPGLVPGQSVTLALPGSGELRAGTICWSRDDRVGFRFAFSLPLDLLATLLASGGR